MGWVLDFAKSSVGAKVLMGLTGVLMVGWLFAHLGGNLMVFAGPEQYNLYAEKLHTDLAPALWGARIALAPALLLHILAGLRLTRLNRAARPERYRALNYRRSTSRGRTMAISGLLVAGFLTFHLAHLTFQVTHPEHFGATDAWGRNDLYRGFILGFQQPGISIAYIVSIILLGMHLSHGISSMFQSMGLNGGKYTDLIEKLGPGVSGVYVVANISMPVAVLAGVLGLGG